MSKGSGEINTDLAFVEGVHERVVNIMVLEQLAWVCRFSEQSRQILQTKTLKAF